MAKYQCIHAYDHHGYICCDLEKEPKNNADMAHALCRYYNFCKSSGCSALKAGFDKCEKLVPKEDVKPVETAKKSGKKKR